MGVFRRSDTGRPRRRLATADPHAHADVDAAQRTDADRDVQRTDPDDDSHSDDDASSHLHANAHVYDRVGTKQHADTLSNPDRVADVSRGFTSAFTNPRSGRDRNRSACRLSGR
jgi:hypothetical protein